MYCNYISSMNLNTNLISNHIFLTLSWSCWSAQEFCSVGDDSCLILWDARVGSSPVVKVYAYSPILYLNLFLFIISFIELQILRQFFLFLSECVNRTCFLFSFRFYFTPKVVGLGVWNRIQVLSAWKTCISI